MTDSTAAAAAEAERSFDALQAQAQQVQADADAAKAPEGYDIRWPKPAFDLLKRNDSAPDGSPAWLVRCNSHGTTTPAAGTRAADKLGTRAGRLAWCSGCKAEAAKAARAEAKAQEPKAEAAPKAPRTSRAKAEPKAQETPQA